jgi:hypothetical protein
MVSPSPWYKMSLEARYSDNSRILCLHGSRQYFTVRKVPFLDSAIRQFIPFNLLRPFPTSHYHTTLQLQLGRPSRPYEFPNTILYPVLIAPCVLHVHPPHSPHGRPMSSELNVWNSWRNLPQPPLAYNPLTAKYHPVIQHPQYGFMKPSCNWDICVRYYVLCTSVQSDNSSWFGPPSKQSYKMCKN